MSQDARATQGVVRCTPPPCILSEEESPVSDPPPERSERAERWREEEMEEMESRDRTEDLNGWIDGPPPPPPPPKTTPPLPPLKRRRQRQMVRYSCG